jgi:hypothetical protein
LPGAEIPQDDDLIGSRDEPPGLGVELSEVVFSEGRRRRKPVQQSHEACKLAVYDECHLAGQLGRSCFKPRSFRSGIPGEQERREGEQRDKHRSHKRQEIALGGKPAR